MSSGSPSSSDDSIGSRVGRRKRAAEEGSSANLKNFFPARKLAAVPDEKRFKAGNRKNALPNICVPQISSAFDSPSSSSEVVVPDVSPVCCTVEVPLVQSPLGIFGRLPKTCLIRLCHSIPFRILITFGQLSREWSMLLREYVLSGSCRNRFISEVMEYNSIRTNSSSLDVEDPFVEIGTLLKTVTICLTTKTRVRFFMKFVEAMPPHIMSYSGWNNFVRAFTKKWAFNEIEKLFCSFIDMGGSKSIRTDLNKATAATPGSDPALEMKVRYRVRLYFINSADGQRDSAFWLSCILNTQPSIEKKSRLLMILFGPVKNECIGWRSLVDESVESWEDSTARIQPLSDALSSLLHTRDCEKIRVVYKEAEVFQLIEEITTYPEPWAFDNFSFFLANRRPLLTLSIAARCRNSMFVECGNIVIRLKTILRRWGIDALAVLSRSLIGAMVTLQRQQRRSLVEAIYAAFTSSYRENLMLDDHEELVNEEHAAMVELRPLLLELANLVEQA